MSNNRKQRTLTVLSSQETVKHFLYHNRVEFDQLGQSLDDFILGEKNMKETTVRNVFLYTVNSDTQLFQLSEILVQCVIFMVNTQGV